MWNWTNGMEPPATSAAVWFPKMTAIAVAAARKRSAPIAVSFCAQCDQAYCSGCNSSCQRCDQSICSSCLERCRLCGSHVCSDCLQETLCTQCHEKQSLFEEEPEELETPASRRPCLRFTPHAWAKLIYLRDCGPTEVGGFGITQTNDPLLVTDLQLVKQTCTVASVGFDDRAVAEFFDQQVDRGLRPAQFARIWVHTHPGNSAQPSSVDEETFDRVFGPTEWAAMVILARGGQTYCRLQFHVGPGGGLVIPVRIDYSQPFDASDQAAWKSEFEANVKDVTPAALTPEHRALADRNVNELQSPQDDWSALFHSADVDADRLVHEENWYD